MRGIERRVLRLERASLLRPSPEPPLLIVGKPGESREEAILRVCGPEGLPPRRPEDAPHLVMLVVRPGSGSDKAASQSGDLPEQITTSLSV